MLFFLLGAFMNNFIWHCPTKLIFGKDTIQNTGKEISILGKKKILIVTGGGSVKRNGIFDTVIKSIEKENIEFVELSKVQPNPLYALVEKGIDIVKQNNLDFILAVGGGSVIDTAKAISIGCCLDKGQDLWEDIFMKEGVNITKTLGVGVILTIPATGSEMSTSTVITNIKKGFKRGYNSILNYPVFSILDPEVCYSLPAYQTACGASDILAHLMERYFSNTKNVDVSDRLIEADMNTILNYGPLAYNNPNNYDYRAEVMLAGTMAHNNMLSLGRQQDWASHWLEHELSTMYNVAHGAGLSIIFPAWMKYCWKENKMRFYQFATRVMGINLSLENDERVVESAILKLELWYKSMGLPTRLKDIDVKDSKDFELMATRALSGERIFAGHFKQLDHQDIINIYNLAL